MKKSLINVVVLFISSLVNMAHAVESVQPVFDQRDWQLGWSQSPHAPNTKNPVFDEYVLKGEKVDNWSELVTIQSFPGAQKQTNLDVFEASNKTRILTVCPNATWESIEQTANDRIWQFTVKNCSGQSDQSELARAVKTDEAIYLFHYAIKKAPMPEANKSTWMKNLKEIKIAKN